MDWAPARSRLRARLQGLLGRSESTKGMHGKLPALQQKSITGLPSALMYTHREEKSRVDVVDLDPYGTAAPFIDAAVQCIKDEGELGLPHTHLLASFQHPFIRIVVCYLHRPFCPSHHELS